MAFRSLSSFVVTPDELAKALKDPIRSDTRIVPVSAEWYLPNDSRKGSEEFAKLRIPNSRFFDIDDVKDANSSYPHMLPSSQVFADAMSKLGIKREDTLVVYDSPHIGIFSAPRAAWTFKVFGHPKVHLLNNFKLWKEQGLPTESGPIDQSGWEQTEYPVVELDANAVVSFEEMVELVKGGERKGVEILDARPKGRWLGTDPEPREDPNTRSLKTPTELREIFLRKGIDPSSKTDKVLMCGTGVTAAVIESALQLAGIEGKRGVYDGSWTEWAQRVDEKSGLIVKGME